MKKLLILLPVVVLVVAAGVAFSKPEPAEKQPSTVQKQFWESFPRSGFRLGVVLNDNELRSREPGVRVERVLPGSPAERAGLKPGDVIISLDGKKVLTPGDVRSFLKGLDEEKEVQMEIVRDGDPMTVKITPEERNGLRMVMGGGMYLGVNLQELDTDLASYFQVDPGAGVLVTRVEPGSPAEKAGIRSGDIITHVNGEKISAPPDVVGKMDNVREGDTLEITVLRHGAEKKLSAKPEERGWPHPEIGNLPELHNMLNNPEFQQDMEDLRREMDTLREDMQLRKEDLNKMKDQIQKEIREEMEQLRKELKENKDAT